MIHDNLRQIALEIASTCYRDNVALTIQIGKLRTTTAWFCANQGMTLAASQETAETMVGVVLDEVMTLRAATGLGEVLQ